MVREEMLKLVKSNLKLDTEDYDLLILDWIQEAISFCNLRPEDLPELLEPFIRKKVKAIIMRPQKEPATNRTYPASRRAMEVLPMPLAAVTAATVFTVCLMRISRSYGGLGG